MDLKEFYLEHLYKCTRDPESSIKFARDAGLLAREMKCMNNGCCWVTMSQLNYKRSGDGYHFRCRTCRKQASIRKNSVFEGSKLPIGKILQFIYFWSFGLDKVEFLKRELHIGSAHTIIDWKKFIKDLCSGLNLKENCFDDVVSHIRTVYPV